MITSTVIQAGCAAAGSEAAQPANILDLPTIVSSRTCQFLLIGDLGYSSAAGTTTWADQSAQGRHFTIADANAPVRTQYSAISDRFAILGNGTDQYIQHTGFNAADQWWYLFVVLPVAWATGGTLMDASGAASRQRICQNPTANPNWRLQGNTANGPTNAGGANGSWYRMRAHFTGDTTDYLRIGSTDATGTNVGSTPNVGRRLFAAGGGSPSAFFNGALAVAAAWDDEPTSTEMGNVDTLLTDYYSANVGVG